MRSTKKLLFWLMIIGVLHMSEQLVFGVEELQLFKPMMADYYQAMAAIGPDRATVVLVTVVVTFFTWLCYAILAGGRLRLVALSVFGLMGAGAVTLRVRRCRLPDPQAPAAARRQGLFYT